MAKVTPSTIQGAYASTSELNANFALIAAEFENALSLDGTSPNQMSADLDLNNQDIINANSVGANAVTIGGVGVVPGDTLTVPDAVNVPFTQDGTGAVLSNVDAKLNEIVSVKDYGAVGDGATDDAAAIQAAYDANPGRRIHIPKGVYAISSAINLNLDQTTLEGDGAGSWIYGYNARLTTGTVFKWTGAAGGTMVYAGSIKGNVSQVITAISKANPAEITIVGHGYITGSLVKIDGGDMTEIDETFIVTSTGADTFTLDGEDSTAYTTYTTGGTATQSVGVSGDEVSAAGFKGILLDGDGVANRGLKVQTLQGGKFKDFAIKNVVSKALETGITHSTHGGVSPCQNNVFEDFVLGVTGSASCIIVSGELTNLGGKASSFNVFRNAKLVHKDGNAITITRGDDNHFEQVSVTRAAGGQGVSLLLSGTAKGHAYGNWFKAFHASIAEGLTLAWGAGQTYVANQYIQVGRNLYQTSAGGTAGTTKPVHTSGSVSDGGVTWLYIGNSHCVVSSATGTGTIGNHIEATGIDYNLEIVEEFGTEIFYTYMGRELSSGLNQNLARPEAKSPPIKFSNTDYDDPLAFDWYSEEDWTPTITFDTAGDLSVVYDTPRTGVLIRKAGEVTYWFEVKTTTFTHTTASGNLRIGGITADYLATHLAQGNIDFQGITKAGYTNYNLRALVGASYFHVHASGTGVGISSVQASDMPSGGTVILRGSITFKVV